MGTSTSGWHLRVAPPASLPESWNSTWPEEEGESGARREADLAWPHSPAQGQAGLMPSAEQMIF